MYISSTISAVLFHAARFAKATCANFSPLSIIARAANGTIVVDAIRFPSGIKVLADYVHSNGLEFDIYTDAGMKTCQGQPGSFVYESIDAKTYAGWGVDCVKIDWRNSAGIDAPAQYAKVRDALALSGRKIVFSICEWGSNRPWESIRIRWACKERPCKRAQVKCRFGVSR